MLRVELSAGTVEYEDTGGDGPVVVLTGGLIIGGSLWRHVVRDLRDDYRCVVPTLPMGAHRLPMRPDADLSPRGVALLLGEFLDHLDLRDVTLVENDTGRTQTLVGERAERVARLVLVSCEAFDNYPPGLPGRLMDLAAKVPGGLNALVQPMRLRPLRRLPLVYGWMANPDYAYGALKTGSHPRYGWVAQTHPSVGGSLYARFCHSRRAFPSRSPLAPHCHL